jgi:hypothetical protein
VHAGVPPEVYGGAGVHVEYLAKELSRHVDLTVHFQGADRPTAVAHRPGDRLKNANPALQTICTGLSIHERTLDVVPLEALRETPSTYPTTWATSKKVRTNCTDRGCCARRADAS